MIEKVILDELVYKNLLELQKYISEKYYPDKEWSVVGTGFIENGIMKVLDFEVPRQTVDRCSVIYDFDDLLRIMKRRDYVAIIHSHHSMSLEMSGLDVENLETILGVLVDNNIYNYRDSKMIYKKVRPRDISFKRDKDSFTIYFGGISLELMNTEDSPVSTFNIIPTIPFLKAGFETIREKISKGSMELRVVFNRYYAIVAGIVFYNCRKVDRKNIRCNLYCKVFSRRYWPVYNVLSDVEKYDVEVCVKRLNERYKWKKPKEMLKKIIIKGYHGERRIFSTYLRSSLKRLKRIRR